MAEQKKYAQYEEAWNQSEKRMNTSLQLARGFQVADVYLNRTYLESFSSAPIVPGARALMDTTKMRLLEITKLVYDQKEKFTDKLKSVYSALHSLNSAVALLIQSDGDTVRFFIGTRSMSNAAIAGDVLESTLKGNFPGISYCNLSVSETEKMIEEIKRSGVKSLSSVSVVPSMRDENVETESFVQGIEKFIDTMSGKTYVAVCLATPLDKYTMEQRKHGYEELCSALSPHAKLTLAYGENESSAVNESISSSFSKSINRSVSNSNTTSSSHSSGTNSSTSGGTSSNFGTNSSQSGDGSSSGWNAGFGSNSGWSNGSFDSYTSGSSFTQSFSDSQGSSATDGRTRGTTETTGSSKTITLTYENKGVETLMKRAQAELERFKLCESFGMWEFCGYFMSKDIHTTALAGNVYKALMTGDNSNVESAHLNIWSLNQAESINRILDYVCIFRTRRRKCLLSRGDIPNNSSRLQTLSAAMNCLWSWVCLKNPSPVLRS